MQKKFERGSEGAEMLTDIVRLVQNTYIPEDAQEYWDKTLSECARCIEKYSSVDRAFIEGFLMMFYEYLDIKHKASKLNVGDKFQYSGYTYEVVNGVYGNSARKE